VVMSIVVVVVVVDIVVHDTSTTSQRRGNFHGKTTIDVIARCWGRSRSRSSTSVMVVDIVVGRVHGEDNAVVPSINVSVVP
jgi:hypothetical protein